MVPSGSEASSGWTWVCRAIVHSSWGSSSSHSNMASSVGVGEATGSYSTTSSMEAPIRSSLSISGLRHHQMALQSMQGGASNHSAHCWRAWASATIWSLLTNQMSLGPWGLGGKEEEILASQANQARWGVPPAGFLLWAVGSLQVVACFWASSCSWASLGGLAFWLCRDWRCGHQVGSLSLSARYMGIQSLGLTNGSKVARCLGLALCQAVLVFQDWLPPEPGAVTERAGGPGTSDCLASSSVLGAYGSLLRLQFIP